jgi:flagellar hook-associated protein 1 FlgK
MDEPSQLAFAAPLKSTVSLDNRGEVNAGGITITSEINPTNNALLSSAGALPFDLVYNENAQAWEVTNAPAGYNILPFQNAITPGVTNNIDLTINDVFGNSIDFSIEVSGLPQEGDVIAIQSNEDGVADNQNILAMIGLQTADLIRASTGVDSANQSLVESYSQLVETVGVVTAQSQIEFDANTNIFDQAFNNREEISGVNIDEEAANLLKFEQAYNAAAQVIATARELFDRILSI